MRAPILSVLLLLLACMPSNDTAAHAPSEGGAAPRAAFLGLRTAKYVAPDLAAAKQWYADVLGIQPYFDQPFYVGFNVGGFELGIVPDSAAEKGGDRGIAYWGVTNADSAWQRLIAAGATPLEPIQDVGDGVRIGSVYDPFGNPLGIVENPHFRIEP